MQSTNQCTGKGVEICGSIDALYGREAEVSFMDCFLEWKVTDVQSGQGMRAGDGG